MIKAEIEGNNITIAIHGKPGTVQLETAKLVAHAAKTFATSGGRSIDSELFAIVASAIDLLEADGHVVDEKEFGEAIMHHRDIKTGFDDLIANVFRSIADAISNDGTASKDADASTGANDK